MTHTGETLHQLPEPPRMVDRDAERATLHSLLRAAQSSHGSMVLIGGEAGIGKTMLVQDLRNRAAGEGVLILTGHCYDLTATPPYGPWIEIVNGAREIDGLPEPPQALRSAEDLRRAQSQEALLNEVRDFLVALGERFLPVVVLEDMHWSDPASLELLRFLGRQVADLRLMLIVTYRDDELDRQDPLYQFIPYLVREARAHRMNLHPFDRNATHAFVSSRYDLAPPNAARLVNHLHERAEGNPFFMSEIARSLEEQRLLYPEDHHWRLDDLSHTHVPPLVRQVIDGRLARLDEESRRMLEVAAVIGHDVPMALWSRVVDASEDVLADVFEQALDAHLLVDTVDGTGLQFRHALIREVLYQGLPLPRRRLWHRRVGETLIEEANVDPDAVAYHFQQAGDNRAVEWFMRAGERAQRTAWLTAAERFETALRLMERYHADPGTRGWLLVRLAQIRRFSNPRQCLGYLDQAEQLAKEANDAVLTACVLFYRGEKRFIMGDVREGIAEKTAGVAALDALSQEDRARFHEMVTSDAWPDEIVPHAALVAVLANLGRFAESQALAARVGDSSLAAGASLNDASQLVSTGFHVYHALAATHASAGRPDEARAAFAHARDGFRATHNQVLVGISALRELLSVLMPYAADDLSERKRIATIAEDALTRAGDARGGWNPRLAQLPLLWLEAQWDEARSLCLESRARSRATPRTELTYAVLGNISREQGDGSLAWDLIWELFPEGPKTEPGSIDFLLGLYLLRLAADLSIDDGDLTTAQQWLEAHDRWLIWSGSVLGQADGHLAWARLFSAVRDNNQAREHASSALKQAQEPHQQPLTMLRTFRILGELDTREGQFAEGEHHLQHAQELAEDCQAPFELALTLFALAELRFASGIVDQVEPFLKIVRQICEPIGATRLLARVDDLTERLRVGPEQDGYPAGLTPREVEVLRLVARGMTNTQAAEKLFISPRTVDQHLRSIYNKLGVSSRAGATRFAVENQIG